MAGLLRRWRRERLLRKPFPKEWEAILRANVPYMARLNDWEQRRLRELVRVFMAEKYFEGLGGLTMTDEIRVTIAAQACMLLLHRPDDDVYPGLTSVLVYPTAYVAHGKQIGPGGLVTEGATMRAGESWNHHTSWGSSVAGPVVLAWDAVRRGATDINDGENVVFHEFAHQLDGQSGGMEGAPQLEHRSSYIAWARVLGGEFERLRRAAAWGEPTLLNKYGATSPAEFFAVATEAYFERPMELRALHPELFAQLRGFYDG
ncbi:MAG TPA: M90 family metallopeptidase [Phycisphaerales bacterium]|nr:M90 family metallopeptidase [Phycisphaerales bacterium]